MPDYKFTYFGFQGRGEVSRYLFAIAGVDYQDIRKNRDNPSEWKADAMFGQLPTLEVDGKMLCQSHVIERFLAQQFGMEGKNDWDKIRAEMIVGCIEDSTYVPGVKAMFEKDPAKKEEYTKNYEDMIPIYLKNLDKIIMENNGGKNGYFVGDEMTYADVVFYHQWGSMPSLCSVNINLDEWPALKKVRDNVGNHPRVKAWEAKRPQ